MSVTSNVEVWKIGVESGPFFLLRSAPPCTASVSCRKECFFIARLLSAAHPGCVHCRHWRQPLPRACMPPADQFVELLLQRARYRTRLAVANRAEINLAQRDDLGCRAAHEHFVGDVQLVARDRFLIHRVAEIRSEE